MSPELRHDHPFCNVRTGLIMVFRALLMGCSIELNLQTLYITAILYLIIWLMQEK